MTISCRPADDYKDGAWLVYIHDERKKLTFGTLFRGPDAELRARAQARELRKGR